MKKAELHEYVNDFPVDYDSINVYDLFFFHKYLMKKHNIR